MRYRLFNMVRSEPWWWFWIAVMAALFIAAGLYLWLDTSVPGCGSRCGY